MINSIEFEVFDADAMLEKIQSRCLEILQSTDGIHDQTVAKAKAEVAREINYMIDEYYSLPDV